jgi:hypothetical protein
MIDDEKKIHQRKCLKKDFHLDDDEEDEEEKDKEEEGDD